MNVIEAKLRSYIETFKYNKRLINYISLATSVLTKSSFSNCCQINFYKEVKSCDKFPRDFKRPGNFISILINVIGLTEQEAEIVIDWNTTEISNKILELPNLAYEGRIYHYDYSNRITGLIYYGDYVIDPFQESIIKIQSSVFSKYFEIVYNLTLDSVRYSIFHEVAKCPICSQVLSIDPNTKEFYEHLCCSSLDRDGVSRNSFITKYGTCICGFYLALFKDCFKFGITHKLDRNSVLKADSFRFLIISSAYNVATLEYNIKQDLGHSEYLQYSEWKDFKESFRKNFQSLKDSSSTHYNISIYL